MTTKQVRIPSGRSNILLPNGGLYDAGDVVTLTEEQFALIDSGALNDEVIDVSTIGVEIAPGLYEARIWLELKNFTGTGTGKASFDVPIAGTVMSWEFITKTPANTASATVTAKLAIETVAIGTVDSTLTLATATANALGSRIAATAVSGQAAFAAGDTITVDCSAAATPFGASDPGNGYIRVLYVG
jgi:hypothetical protein